MDVKSIREEINEKSERRPRLPSREKNNVFKKGNLGNFNIIGAVKPVLTLVRLGACAEHHRMPRKSNRSTVLVWPRRDTVLVTSCPIDHRKRVSPAWERRDRWTRWCCAHRRA